MGKICIIGPRSSGKTTYLAALAYQPEQARRGGRARNYTIQSLNDETRKLAAQAENIIVEGASLEQNKVDVGGIYSLPFYSFHITIHPWFRKPEQINLAVRDYPGEIFDELELGLSNQLHKEFIDDCLMKDVVGCLILLSEWKRGTDKFYSRVLECFTKLMNSHDRVTDLRLAIAMSKCERGELWPGRLDPEIDLFDVHLPKTKATLKAKVPPNNLQFYAISTFGVLWRNDPRPNRVDEMGTDGRNSVLREANCWKPYGMMSPLYWLSTGKRIREDA